MKGLPLGFIMQKWDRVSAKAKLIIFAAIAVLFAFLFPVICSMVGGNVGATIGTAVGSFHAVTEDMPKAYNEGKAYGLSAEDTGISINKIQDVGKLDVLAANAKMTDVLKVGDKYAALYDMGADVIFSVDLSKAEFLYGDKMVEIVLPKPEVEFNLDSTRTRLVDEWQRLFLNGSAKDGVDAYINSMKKIKTNAKEQLSDYDYLEKQALVSAKQQVMELAKMLVEPGVSIEVRFMETEGTGL